MKDEKIKLNIWIIVAASVAVVLVIAAIVVGIALNNKNKVKVEEPNQNSVNVNSNNGSTNENAMDNSNIIASLKEDKIYKGIKISNIQLTYSDGETKIVADVENVSGNEINEISII